MPSAAKGLPVLLAYKFPGADCGRPVALPKRGVIVCCPTGLNRLDVGWFDEGAPKSDDPEAAFPKSPVLLAVLALPKSPPAKRGGVLF